MVGVATKHAVIMLYLGQGAGGGGGLLFNSLYFQL